jgi:hypothetical protein
MIRRHILAAAAASLAALALAPQPLAAQDHSETQTSVKPPEDPFAALGKMFVAEPLTAEQEARLPQAQRIVALLIPDGTLGELMGKTFEQFLNPAMAEMGAPGAATITKATGFDTAELSLTEAQTAELAALFDPAYAERQKREMALMPEMMRGMMTTMEPTMRKAMGELYAIHFSPAELNDIETFFRTPSGTAYARKSFTMSSDPRIIAATMDAMPQMMGGFAEMEKKLAAASADLPKRRSFADLTAAEKAKVAKLTGTSVAEIEERLAAHDALD